MRLVHAAAADRVVGLVLQEQTPGAVEQPRLGGGEVRLRAAWAGAGRRLPPPFAQALTQQAGPDAERLRPACQELLAGEGALFDPHARGEDAGEHVRLLAAAELAPAPGQGRPPVELRLHLVEELGQAAVDHLAIGQAVVGGADEAGQLSLGRDVVGAPHHQQRARLGAGLKEPPDRLDLGGEGLLLHREGRADAVAIGHVHGQHLAAVRRLPDELARRQRIVGAAPEDATVDAEAAQQRRQVGDLAEGVGQVADSHRPAERLRRPMAPQQVTHQRLAGGQELVRDDVPGPDGQPPLPRQALDRLAPVGAHLQVVLDEEGVAVQQEVAVVRVALQDLQQQVEEADQAGAVALVGQVPLAVPVRVGDEDEARSVGRGLGHG